MAGETVLLIDTDNETEEKILSTLETEGYLVFTAIGRDEGAAMAQKLNPSLIFVDTDSTGAGGLEICKMIHDIKSMKSIPIVILASDEGVLDSVDTSFYGIASFLKKPLNPDELKRNTEEVLTMKSYVYQPVEEEDKEILIEDFKKEEQVVDIKENYTESMDIFDTPETDKVSEEVEPEKEQQVLETEKIYPSKVDITKGRKNIKVLVPVIIITIILILAAGIISYRSFFRETEFIIPDVVKTTPPVQQHVDKEVSSMEIQEKQQSIEEKEPVKAASADTKPSGKKFYSVQIGAFMDKNNADDLTKRYKEKGYETFINEGRTNDNKVIYRVLIGRFEKRGESSKMAIKVQKRERIRVTIFSDIY